MMSSGLLSCQLVEYCLPLCQFMIQFFFIMTVLFPFHLFVNSRYEFLAYTVNLNYQNTLLNTVEEISIVVIGPFFNIILFCLLILFCWGMQRLFGTFPNIFSRFIMAFGINALLDPIWILIVDSALMRYKLIVITIFQNPLIQRFITIERKRGLDYFYK